MDEMTRDAVADRVEWWLRDMPYKPPEVLNAGNGWYWQCMARDIADVAYGKLDFTWSGRRLDPPQ